MNDFVGNNASPTGERDAGTVRRRHVLYVEGYDPLGAQGYYNLFRRTCERFRRLWSITATLQPLEIDSADFAHWLINLEGANWQVATHYDFLRLESFVRSDIDRATARQVLYGLGWCLGDLLSGTDWRIVQAAWRFIVHLIYFQLLLLAWLAVAATIGLAAGYATNFFASSVPLAFVSALLVAFLSLVALRPIAERRRILQFSSCWVTLRRFARGRPTWLDHVIDAGARRVLAAVRTSDADELALVGHSTGGVIASAIMARALELDPDLGLTGPRLVLLTLGSVMPAAALHPAAHRMRAIVSRLATAKNVAWIDCQSRKDVMCFANFDPVDGVGVHVGARRNPLVWPISFKDMIAPEAYNRFRWNHFRIHYQYIMAGDRPAPYDYVLLVGGPMPIAEWPQRDREFFAAFRDAAAVEGDHRGRDTMVGAAP